MQDHIARVFAQRSADFEAIERRDGGDCHPLGAHHDQQLGNSVLHGPNHPMENQTCPSNERSVP